MNGDDAAQLYNSGLALMRKGDLAAAKDMLVRALALHPHHFGASFNLSALLRKEGNLDEAERILEALTEHKPADTNLHFRLGEICSIRGDEASAVTRYKKALELDPSNRNAAIALVAILGRRGENAEASDILSRCLVAHPEDTGLGIRLAEQMQRMGNAAGAEKALREVLRFDPDHRRAIDRLIELLSADQRLEEAGQLLERLLAENGFELAAAERLGELQYRRGDMVAAEKWLREVVDADPTRINAVNKLCDILRQQDQSEESMAILRRYLDMAGIEVTLAERLAVMEWDHGNLPAAEHWLRKTLEAEPGRLRANVLLFDLLVAGNREDDAVRIARENLERGAYHPTLHQRAAMLEVNRGNAEAAEALFREILERDPANAAALRRMTAILYESDRLQEARDMHGRATAAMRQSFAGSFDEAAKTIRQGPAARAQDQAPASLPAIPDRSAWSPDQRFQWGRKIYDLISNWAVYQEGGLADIARLVRGPDWNSLGLEATGAILVGSHVGLYFPAIAYLAESGLDYKVITSNPSLMLSLPEERVMNAKASDNHLALARTISFLKKSGIVYVAGDGEIGRPYDKLYTYRNHRQKFTVGAATMAFFAKVPVYWYNAVWDGDAISIKMNRGPDISEGARLEDWYEVWLDFYWEGFRDALASGAENLSAFHFQQTREPS